MALFGLGNLLNLAQSQSPDLSFGLGTDGTFSGSAIPSASNALSPYTLSSTPTTGMFSGEGGMNPMMMEMAAKALSGLGQHQQAQQPVQFAQYADPQAILSAPMPSGPAIGHALLTGGR